MKLKLPLVLHTNRPDDRLGLKSEIVLTKSQRLKTPSESHFGNTFTDNVQSASEFLQLVTENFLKPIEKTPKPTVWTSLRTVLPMWGRKLTKDVILFPYFHIRNVNGKSRF